MRSNFRKDRILDSVILFAAWLVVITAGVGDQVESSSQVVPIAYAAY